MTKKFKPLMASAVEEEYTDALMNGDGIRTDKAHDFFEVIVRDRIAVCNGCVGMGDHKRIHRADDVLKDILKRMRKEGYVIMTKPCSDTYTGRFKATTYYLAGEEV